MLYLFANVDLEIDCFNYSYFQDENIPENFKFAPKDQMPLAISHKDDHHGIGYSGLDPTAALHKKVKKSTAVKAKTKAGSKLSFFGQVRSDSSKIKCTNED